MYFRRSGEAICKRTDCILEMWRTRYLPAHGLLSMHAWEA